MQLLVLPEQELPVCFKLRLRRFEVDFFSRHLRPVGVAHVPTMYIVMITVYDIINIIIRMYMSAFLTTPNPLWQRTCYDVPGLKVLFVSGGPSGSSFSCRYLFLLAKLC